MFNFQPTVLVRINGTKQRMTFKLKSQESLQNCKRVALRTKIYTSTTDLCSLWEPGTSRTTAFSSAWSFSRYGI